MRTIQQNPQSRNDSVFTRKKIRLEPMRKSLPHLAPKKHNLNETDNELNSLEILPTIYGDGGAANKNPEITPYKKSPMILHKMAITMSDEVKGMKRSVFSSGSSFWPTLNAKSPLLTRQSQKNKQPMRGLTFAPNYPDRPSRLIQQIYPNVNTESDHKKPKNPSTPARNKLFGNKPSCCELNLETMIESDHHLLKISDLGLNVFLLKVLKEEEVRKAASISRWSEFNFTDPDCSLLSSV